MQIYKLVGTGKCSVCENQAEFYIDTLDFCLCKKCTVELYRALGEHIVPRAIPNVILRSDAMRKNGEKYLGVSFAENKNKASSLPEKCDDFRDETERKKSVEIAGVKITQIGTKTLQNTGKLSRNERRNKWQILKKKSLPEFTKNSKD